MQERGVVRLWEVARFDSYFLATRSSQMNAEAANDVQDRVGDVLVGVTWVCILIFVWLQGKMHLGESCCEVVGSCKVQLCCEAQCSTSSQPDKNLYACVYVCVISSIKARRPYVREQYKEFNDIVMDTVWQC